MPILQRSGTNGGSVGQLTTNNTSQQVVAANSNRASVAITNTSSTTTVYVNHVDVADADDYPLLPSQSITYVNHIGPVNVFCATSVVVGWSEESD